MAGENRGFAKGLLIATLIAAALRFTHLGTVPVSLYCDEAFHGYEAHSLLTTGKDTRGVSFPFFFDIFGKGWGEPLYIYLTIPSVALFGLTAFACRFVAALAGSLAVTATGLMTAALVPHGRRAGLAAAFLMAVSPWSFHLSRVAFQASLLPLTLAAGFWLAARALKGDASRGGMVRALPLLAAAITLGLSLYTYTISRLILPLLLAGFALLHRKRIAAAGRPVVVALLAGALIATPIVVFTFTEQGRQRFSDVSLFSRSADRPAPESRDLITTITGNYLSYYSPRFLVTEGDPNGRHSIRGHGVLHPHDMLLLIAGVVCCLAAPGPGVLFLLWWLLAFPAGAALTIDPRHAVRAICGQPGLYAIAGVGAAAIWRLATSGTPGRLRSVLARGALVIAACASIASAVGYFRDYFVEYPVYSGPDWQYGLKELYEYTDSVAAGHDSIYITRNEDYPFIHYLFYRKIPPREYQVHRLSRTPYLFDEEIFYKGPRIPNRANPIFVWKPFEVPAAGVEVHNVIKYPDGSDAFVIAW